MWQAANPGCILEDFVRWYSPPDWSQSEQSDETKDFSDGGDSGCMRGHLSTRMQKEGPLLISPRVSLNITAFGVTLSSF